MWSYEVREEEVRLVGTAGGTAVLEALHTARGRTLWNDSRKKRRVAFHHGEPCPADPLPQVLGGRGSCQDCEGYYLDLLVVSTVKVCHQQYRAVQARGRGAGQQSRPAPAPRQAPAA